MIAPSLNWRSRSTPTYIIMVSEVDRCPLTQSLVQAGQWYRSRWGGCILSSGRSGSTLNIQTNRRKLGGELSQTLGAQHYRCARRDRKSLIDLVAVHHLPTQVSLRLWRLTFFWICTASKWLCVKFTTNFITYFFMSANYFFLFLVPIKKLNNDTIKKESNLIRCNYGQHFFCILFSEINILCTIQVYEFPLNSELSYVSDWKRCPRVYFGSL